MAKSKFALKADEFIKNLDKAKLSYHMDIMSDLTKIIDEARIKSAKEYIIPRKGRPPRTRKEFFRYTYKVQPAHPTKLTERTGLLRKILIEKGNWSISKKIARLKANIHLLCWIRPQQIANSIIYLARTSITKKGNEGVEYRVGHETHGDKRGRKRPFLEPAFIEIKEFMVEKLKGNIYKLRSA